MRRIATCWPSHGTISMFRTSTQEAALRAVKGRFDGRSSLYTWLCAIAKGDVAGVNLFLNGMQGSSAIFFTGEGKLYKGSSQYQLSAGTLQRLMHWMYQVQSTVEPTEHHFSDFTA